MIRPITPGSSGGNAQVVGSSPTSPAIWKLIEKIMIRMAFMVVLLVAPVQQSGFLRATHSQDVEILTVLPSDEALTEIVSALDRKEILTVLCWTDSLKIYQLGIKEQSTKKERIVYVTSLFIFNENGKTKFSVTREKITKERN